MEGGNLKFVEVKGVKLEAEFKVKLETGNLEITMEFEITGKELGCEMKTDPGFPPVRYVYGSLQPQPPES